MLLLLLFGLVCFLLTTEMVYWQRYLVVTWLVYVGSCNRRALITSSPSSLAPIETDNNSGNSDRRSGNSDRRSSNSDRNSGTPVGQTGTPVAQTGSPVTQTGNPVGQTGNPVAQTGSSVAGTCASVRWRFSTRLYISLTAVSAGHVSAVGFRWVWQHCRENKIGTGRSLDCRRFLCCHVLRFFSRDTRLCRKRDKMCGQQPSSYTPNSTSAKVWKKNDLQVVFCPNK